jgi:hypothetical protein
MGPANREFEFQVPRHVIVLRGLGQKLELDRAIRKLRDDNTIDWNVCSKSKGKVYDMFWFEFATYPGDLDEWEVVLKSRFPRSAERIHYLGIITGWNTRARVSNKLEAFIEILLKVFPEINSFLPFIILSNIIMVVLLDNKNQTLKEIKKSIMISDKIDVEFINCALKILLQLDTEKVDDKFLLWSSAWNMRRSDQIDLLTTSNDVIRFLSEKNIIGSDIEKPSIQCIETMKIRRKTIRRPDPKSQSK